MQRMRKSQMQRMRQTRRLKLQSRTQLQQRRRWQLATVRSSPFNCHGEQLRSGETVSFATQARSLSCDKLDRCGIRTALLLKVTVSICARLVSKSAHLSPNYTVHGCVGKRH